jgi:hypothetical protein
MAKVFLEQVDHQIEERNCATAGNDVAFVNNHVTFLEVNTREPAPEIPSGRKKRRSWKFGRSCFCAAIPRTLEAALKPLLAANEPFNSLVLRAGKAQGNNRESPA